MRARVEAIEAHTRRYIKQAGATDSTAQKIPDPIGPPPPLLVIPVVVHVIYSAQNQNLSDVIIRDQIEALNLAFRGQLSPGPNGAPVPAAFASRVGDARVSFCLATRDPGGNPTTGITRRDNTGTSYTSSFSADAVKQAGSGGTTAWNTAHYLNIWVGDLTLGGGWSVFPGLATYPGEDGVAMDYRFFGRGHSALNPRYSLGRLVVHEVGHWLNLQHIWGDDGAGCAGSDNVSDTPNQALFHQLNPTFPSVSCGNGPDGAMFMNQMDYVDDDSKLLFSAGQALRMQAIFASGNYRESLKSSPGLTPTLSISSHQGVIPAAVFCGDQTDYRFRPTVVAPGCGGGSTQYQWTATNGWTMTAPNWIDPRIIPNGTSGSTITLTGTYTNIHGVSFPLNPASVTVGYNPAAGTPVFTSGPAARCPGTSYAAAVAPVAGATGYQWTVPPGFMPTGQVTTTAPTLSVTPNAGIAGDFYLLTCQALSGSCPASATASVPLTVNGGPDYRIVDSDAMQNYQGVVCQRNGIFLELVPVRPVMPGAVNVFPIGTINWSSGGQPTDPTPFPLQAKYYTVGTSGTPFTVTAQYYDACNTLRFAVPYSATTAPAAGGSLGNNYSCTPYQWRQAPPAPSAPYPNPAAGTLHLPGYQGPVVVYNPQGKPVQTLLAPGTAAGASVDTRAWPAGLYVVTGRDLTGAFQRHNVQIQH